MVLNYAGVEFDIRSTAEMSFLKGCLMNKNGCGFRIGETNFKRMHSGSLVIDGTHIRDFNAANGLIEVIGKLNWSAIENDRNDTIVITNDYICISDRSIKKDHLMTCAAGFRINYNRTRTVSLDTLSVLMMDTMNIVSFNDNLLKFKKVSENGTMKVYEIHATIPGYDDKKDIQRVWRFEFDSSNPIKSKLTLLPIDYNAVNISKIDIKMENPA